MKLNRVLPLALSPADSEKFHEMERATESPPRECFLLDDESEFPPMLAAAVK